MNEISFRIMIFQDYSSTYKSSYIMGVLIIRGSRESSLNTAQWQICSKTWPKVIFPIVR